MGTTNHKCHIKQIREAFTGAGMSRAREGLKNCLNFIAQDVNKDENHFIFELIQNADDCEFPSTNGEVPSIKFYLSDAHIVVRINEKGFSYDDVESLCHAGNSSKIARHDTTGEKGLGFKSVFHYSSKPHIFSAGYQFFFEDDGDLGHVCPTWIDIMTNIPTPAHTKDGTAIYLPARKRFSGREKRKAVGREICIARCALLFLRRIRILEVFHDTENEASEVIEKVQGQHGKYSVTIRHSRKMPPSEEAMHFVLQKTTIAVPEDKLTARRRNDETIIQLAFPVTATGKASALHGDASASRADTQTPIPDVYATLPIRHYGFPFLIQANWELVGSREEIHENSAMNIFLRDNIAKAFCDAFFNIFKESDGLRCTYYRYLCSGTTGFLGQVQKNIVNRLKDEECVFTNCGKWIAPKKAVLPDRDQKCYLVANCRRLRDAADKYYIDGGVPKDIYRILRKLGAKDFDQEVGFQCLKYAMDDADQVKKLEWPDVYDFVQYIQMGDSLEEFRGKLYRSELKLFPVGKNRIIQMPDLVKDLDDTPFVPLWFRNPKDTIADKMGVTVLSVNVPRPSPGYDILCALGICDHCDQPKAMQQRLLWHALNLPCKTEEEAWHRCRFAHRILKLDKWKDENLLEAVKEKLQVCDEDGNLAAVHEVYLPSNELRVMSKLFDFRFINNEFLKDEEMRDFFKRVGVQDVISVDWTQNETLHFRLNGKNQRLKFEEREQDRLTRMWGKTWNHYVLWLPEFPEKIRNWMRSTQGQVQKEEAEERANAFLRFFDNNWSSYETHFLYYCCVSFHHNNHRKCEHNENSCMECKTSKKHHVNVQKFPRDVQFLPFLRALRTMKVPTTAGWRPLQETYHMNDDDDTLGAAFNSAPRLIQRLDSTSFLQACGVSSEITETLLLKRLHSLAKSDDTIPLVLNEVVSIYKLLHERFPKCREHEILKKEKVILCLSLSTEAAGSGNYPKFVWKEKRNVRREFYRKDTAIFQDTELDALYIPSLSPEQTRLVKEDLLPFYDSTLHIAKHPDIADYISALRDLKLKTQNLKARMMHSWYQNEPRQTIHYVYDQLNYMISGSRASLDTELRPLKDEALWFTNKQEWKHIKDVYVDDKKINGISAETFGVNVVSVDYKKYSSLFDSVEARLLSKCWSVKSLLGPGHRAEDDPFWTKRYHRALLSIAQIIKKTRSMMYDEFKQDNCKKWRELRAIKVMKAKQIVVQYELNGKISRQWETDHALDGTIIFIKNDVEHVHKLLRQVICRFIFGDSVMWASIEAMVDSILLCLFQCGLAGAESCLEASEDEWGLPLDEEVRQALLDDSATCGDTASSSLSSSTSTECQKTSPATKMNAWCTDTTDRASKEAARCKPPPPVITLASATSTAASTAKDVDKGQSKARLPCALPGFHNITSPYDALPSSTTETSSATPAMTSSPFPKAPTPLFLGKMVKSNSSQEAAREVKRSSAKPPPPVLSRLQPISEEDEKKSDDGTPSTGSFCGETPSEDSGCSTGGSEGKGKGVAEGSRWKGNVVSSGKGVAMDDGRREKGTVGESDWWRDKMTAGQSEGKPSSANRSSSDSCGERNKSGADKSSADTTFPASDGWRKENKAASGTGDNTHNPTTHQWEDDWSEKPHGTTREPGSTKSPDSRERQRPTNASAADVQELQQNNYGDGSTPTNISAYAFSKPTGGQGHQGPANVRRDLSMGQKVLEDIIKENKENNAASLSGKNIPVTRVSIDEVFYTQHSISSTFGSGLHAGKPLDTLVEDLLIGVTQPEFLELSGAKFRNRIFSLNNRRLYCLKQYQNMTGGKTFINIKLQPLDAFTARFISGFSTADDGASDPKIL
eukprot:GEMP01000605.1.p1 GENE.GEMP01000605.1~~GEMP01000605.1.p1  ORF type:complete len:1845 (+),score=340.38 GEMP01000605.1:31-5535(+)